MGISYEIDADAGVMFTVADGEIGAADIQANRDRFTADPLYKPNFASLVDARSATISFNGEEAYGLGTWSKRNRPTAKSAIVIDDYSQGFGRMLVAWGVDNQRLFHDMASAREWLGLPPE